MIIDSLSPLELPINIPLELRVYAISSSTNMLNQLEIYDNISITWSDSEGGLSAIQDDFNNIYDLLVGAIASGGVGDLTSEQLSQYDSDNDGVITEIDLLQFLETIIV